jgi:hypothetical protein
MVRSTSLLRYYRILKYDTKEEMLLHCMYIYHIWESTISILLIGVKHISEEPHFPTQISCPGVAPSKRSHAS